MNFQSLNKSLSLKSYDKGTRVDDKRVIYI